MSDLTWNNALSVQITEVDEDHKKLVSLLSLLNQALLQNKPFDQTEAILLELVTCTAWHFCHEERLMLENSYDNLDTHRQEHQELLDSVQALLIRYQQTETLTTDDINFLEHWLTGHILGSDMEMAEFLAKAM